MSYTPTSWQEGVTPLGPTNMNKIEQGIKGAHDAVDALQSAAAVRTGPNLLDIVKKVFGRSSTAYNPDTGEEGASGIPRYVRRRGGMALWMEEGIPNILTTNQSSVETDTVGFVAVGGGSIARTTSQKWHGSASLQVTANADGDGAATSLIAVDGAKQYVLQVRVLGTPGEHVRVRAWNGGSGFNSPTDITLDGTWQRVAVLTANPWSNNNLCIRVESISGAQTFYLDALAINEGSYPTSWHIGGGTRALESAYVDHQPLGPNWYAVMDTYPDFDSTVNRSVTARVWEAYIDANNYMSLHYDPSSDRMVFRVRSGGSTSDLQSAVLAFNRGDSIRIGMAIVATTAGDLVAGRHLWVSINGGAPGYVSSGVTTTISAGRSYLGRSGTGVGNEFNGAILQPVLINRAPTGTDEIERLLQGGTLLGEQPWPETAGVPFSVVARDGLSNININGVTAPGGTFVVNSPTQINASSLQVRAVSTGGTDGIFARSDVNLLWSLTRLNNDLQIDTPFGRVALTKDLILPADKHVYLGGAIGQPYIVYQNANNRMVYDVQSGKHHYFIQDVKATGDVYANTSERLATDRRARAFALIL